MHVVYRGADGPAEVLCYRDDEPRLEFTHASRAFNFDGDGETFRIASEAQRIRIAHLFDPYLAEADFPSPYRQRVRVVRKTASLLAPRPLRPLRLSGESVVFQGRKT